MNIIFEPMTDKQLDEMIDQEKGRYDISDNCKKTIDNYVTKGWAPGSFTTACLANDLARAASAADWRNWKMLSGNINYIIENVPRGLWGSYDAVHRHIESFKKKVDES